MKKNLSIAFVPIPGASGGSEGVYFMLFSPILGTIGTPTTIYKHDNHTMLEFLNQELLKYYH